MATETTSPPEKLPPEFIQRMQRLLGPEAGAFFGHYDRPPDAALRFNTQKGDPAELAARLPFDLSPLPWNASGRRIAAAEISPGLTVEHAAGLYYIQDAAAQAVGAILDPQPGERILDLAAAPGGKTTDIAARLQDRGLVLANDLHPKRVWDLVRNLERWGARTTAVSNASPEQLAEALPGFFDAVLVDAPCSGEGMFHKVPETIKDWSPEFIVQCAARQDVILASAAEMVRPGGRLVYATCTFAPEEDEDVITRFLARQPEFALETPAWIPGYARGFGPFEDPAAQTPVRLWPHRTAGEGHFIARLRRASAAQPWPEVAAPPVSGTLGKLLPLWERFATETCHPDFALPAVPVLIKSQLYALPAALAGRSVPNLVRPGLQLGSFKKDRFEPAHALAMALRLEEVRRRADLERSAAEAYLRRELLASPGEDGWTLVTLEGRWPLGWGKRVQGRLKNHYPIELRR